MSKKSSWSKVFAGTFAVITIAAIGSTITMAILYKAQISTMNPTPRPTFPVTTTGPPPVMRLPKYLIPESYDLVIWPRLYTRIVVEGNATRPNQTYVFTGNSTVKFHCSQPTGSIYLHSKNLNVTKPQLVNVDTDAMIGVSGLKHHEDQSDFLEIQLEEVLKEGGNYSLFLAFEGEISEYLQSLYVSTYTEGGRKNEDLESAERFVAATNMEPTDARRLFPCFDEPEMKAKFTVTIIHRRGSTALGNAERKESTVIDDDWKKTVFRPSPIMSTYLLAFTVSEFTGIKSPHDRVQITIYARPDATAAGHTKYAANITGKILSYYEKQFGIDYDQRKLDQIALPDLYPVAMENWGLVTYQEGSLLYEEGVSSQLHKGWTASLIAHELAHQWFGNLVTMKWWNEIWLNEGFASYMADFAADHVEPSFRMRETMIMSALHGAFEEDALASSHPLSAPAAEVQTTAQIEGMFDAISYFKGALVLRMLADIVGESVFHEGIKNYLKTFSYGNTDSTNLWDTIQLTRTDHGSETVAMLMEPWTKQSGYPVVTINTTNGEVSQKQFLFNNTVNSSLDWYISIRVMSNISELPVVLLTNKGPERIEEFESKKGEWILANVNCTGYYRVNYDPDNWDRLLTQLILNPARIPLMNRGQLIDDAFNLARAKLVDVTLPLNFTRFLNNETEYLPWESAVRNLKYFVLMFDRSEVYGPMQAYLREQVSGLYNFFRNYTDNSTVPADYSLQENQILAIQVACSNGLPECVTMAKTQFGDWMNSNDTNDINPNLRSVIYCQAVAAGGKKEWEFAWEKFQSSKDTSEKEQLREALSCTRKIWLLSRYLDYTLDPDKIRLMEVASTISLVARNSAGQALAWNFIRAHWHYVSHGGDPASLIEGVTRRFNTQFEVDELERFAADYNVGSASRAVSQAIEQTRVNIQWVGENREAVLQWFEAETADLDYDY